MGILWNYHSIFISFRYDHLLKKKINPTKIRDFSRRTPAQRVNICKCFSLCWNLIFLSRKVRCFYRMTSKFKAMLFEVPVLVQRKQIWPGTMRLRVRSLASLSGLRIQCCCELWCRSQTRLRFGVAVAGSYSSDLVPSLGTSICQGCGPKKQNKANALWIYFAPHTHTNC